MECCQGRAMVGCCIFTCQQKKSTRRRQLIHSVCFLYIHKTCALERIHSFVFCFTFSKHMLQGTNTRMHASRLHFPPKDGKITQILTEFPALHSVTNTSASRLFLTRACIAHPVEPLTGFGSITLANGFWEKALKIVACACGGGEGGTRRSGG
jgi:hypothetical protein